MSRLALAAVLTAALSGAALLTLGPAQARPTPIELPTQGLEAVGHRLFDDLWVRPGVDLGKYDRVQVRSITVTLTRDERRDLEVDERTVRYAREEFQEQLARALGPALADGPAPGTVALDITVTEFIPNSPADPERRFGGTITDSVGVGGAAFAGVLTDSQSGLVVAVIQDQREGAPFSTNLNLRSEFGDARRALERWSRAIPELIGSAQTAQSER